MNANPRAPSTALILVLLIAEDPDDRKLVTDLLDSVPGMRFLIDSAKTLADGRDRLEHARFDICLLDPRLADGDGLDLLASAQMLGLPVPFIILSDNAPVERDRRAMALGAAAELDKNLLDPATLARVIRYSIHQRKIAAGLARQTLRDEATGLISKALYQDRLNRALAFARRRDREVAVMAVDLAFDPEMEAGRIDAALAEVGRRLSGELRETDSVARLAERRIGLLIEGMHTPNHAALVARKILRLLRASLDVDGQATTVVPSLGIALYPREGDDGDALLRQAEAAMRRALSEGGGCSRFGSEHIDHEAREGLVLERAFAAAFERLELRLRFHPEMHFDAGCTGLAAEVFWRHPDQGWVPLDEHLALTDDEMLIKGILDWALAAAAEQLSAWDREGLKPPRLALVVPFRHRAALSLLRGAVADQIVSRHVAPERIELDIAGDLVLGDSIEGGSDLAALKATGIRLALDDFGEGRVAIQDLRPDILDSLKLAPGLFRRLERDERAKTLILALINLGHDLDHAVTAKGARDHHQFALMKQLGCDVVQLASALPPMSAAAAACWLRTDPPGLTGDLPMGRKPSPEIIAPAERLPDLTERTARPPASSGRLHPNAD